MVGVNKGHKLAFLWTFFIKYKQKQDELTH